MPIIHSVEGLARVLGDVVGFEDPLGELRHRGFQIAGELEQALQRTNPSATLSAAQRQRFAHLSKIGKVSFHVGTPPPITPDVSRFAPDDYDIIAGIRLTLADQILNGLRYTQTIPQMIPLIRLLTREQRAQLATVLRGIFTSIPEGSEVGNLAIREGISTAPLNNTDTVSLRLPFSMEVVHTVNNQPDVVGTISGVMKLVTRLSAEIRDLPTQDIAAIVFSLSLPTTSGQGGSPGLEIDPSSPLQPQSPAQLSTLAILLQNYLSRYMGPSFEVSPYINIPKLPGVQVIVDRIDVRSVETPGGGLLMVGVRAGGVGNGPADATRLLRLPPAPGRNIVLRVHERFLASIFERARTKRVLDELVQKETGDNDIKIKSTDVKLSPGEIIIRLDGVSKDKCGPVDVDFTVTQTIQLFLDGEAVRAESSTEISVGNFDMFLCVVLVSLLGLLGSLPAILIAPPLGVFELILIVGGALDDVPEGSTSTTLLSLDSPIPRTELLPVLERLTSRVEDGALIAFASGSFRPDDINTYIYVRVLNRSLPPLNSEVPLAGARVQVCDQDAPPPAGDDVVAPREGEIERIGLKFTNTIRTTYERPRTNPVLKQGTTDFDGRVMFELSPAQVHQGAGYRITEKTIENNQTQEIKVTTTRSPVLESEPDIFFLIHAPAGDADSRELAGGFIKNLRSKRIGGPAAPLTLSVRLQAPNT